MPKSKKRKLKRPSDGGDSTGAGGLMSLRSGLKGLAGQGRPSGKTTPLQRVLEVAFWVAIVGLLGLFAYRRLR